MHDSALHGVIAFLVEELREARLRAMPPASEVQFYILLAHSARRTRRLERLADAFGQLDAQTNPSSN